MSIKASTTFRCNNNNINSNPSSSSSSSSCFNNTVQLKFFFSHSLQNQVRPLLLSSSHSSPSSTITFACRRNPQSSITSSKKSKKILTRNDDGVENLDEDAFEALFKQLEEYLKNDPDFGDIDEDLSKEDLTQLERELEEALGDGDDLLGLLNATAGALPFLSSSKFDPISTMSGSGGGSSGSDAAKSPEAASSTTRQKEKARVSRTSAILWHSHQNDPAAVRKLLEEDPSLVHAHDYDKRTPLHVASLHGWIDVAKCLIEYGADVNKQDRWKNTPLADAEGAKKIAIIELLKSRGGLSYGQNGSHFEQKPVAPPLPNKCDWEMDPSELDFSNSNIIGKGSFGEIIKASWRGTPVAIKRILPSLSDDRLVIQDFRHEVNLLVKLRHPNIVQFLGAVTEKKPLMLITEYLRGGDLHQHLKEKGALSPSTAINFALDIARGMAYLHNEPNVIIHRDLKPRNVLLVNSSADHLKVGDFGLSKLIKVQNSHDVYKMTGETGSYRYMAPEVFKHRKYDKKVDVFSFAMILYEMLDGDPPLVNLEPYEAAKYVADGHRPTFRAKGYTAELRDLTDKCWAADMNDRPSFLEILKKLEKIKETLPSDHHWNIFNP